ncbi:hypothetical protein HK100_000638 [Physocladia obscura]|uniref:Protein kinase domain-containing protein n=1 Tax=Physocladia obscura TaxID=109957 RepID=A0AAD5SZM1_9FUNG|nr:hypothetical protein HK100_000638 [Physocladia obscura]
MIAKDMPTHCSSSETFSSRSEYTTIKKCRTYQKEKARLYDGFLMEDKARIAVMHAFSMSPVQLLTEYAVKRVIGFGSNGVVLAAIDNKTLAQVAIKIIYKDYASLPQLSAPSEIQVLKHLSSLSGTTSFSEQESNILKYIDDWQDQHHFYLVTELFGSDWLQSSKHSTTESIPPIKFIVSHTASSPKTTFTTAPTASIKITLPMSTGSSDLWAWAHAHRAHVWESSNYTHSMLPLHPIKHIIKRVALAIAKVHSLGFYHGDIKLENILVKSTSSSSKNTASGPAVRLADFGHAKYVSFGFSRYGTQQFAPPEVLADSPYRENLDGRAADVFALGMLMYVLLHGVGELPSTVYAVLEGRVGYRDLVREDGGFYPFGSLDEVDGDGQALLDGMCMVDPEQRMDIQQVLAHSWLSDVL